MIVRLILGIALVGLFSGCDQILVRRPKLEDLGGEYVLSLHAEHYLKERKMYSSVSGSRVILTPDGKITLQNIPDCAFDSSGKSANRLLSGFGTWTLTKSLGGYGLNMSIQKGGTIEAMYYGGPWLKLRKRSAYLIEFTVGDPDSGEFLLYEKKG